MKSRLNSLTSIYSRLFAASRCARRHRGNRGIALLITLSILALLGAASLAIVLMVSSDTMINGYYRNYRGSFYASDSGVNVVTEAIQHAITSAANDGANPPLPTNGTVPTSVTNSYSAYQSNAYTIGDTGSWKAQFQMVANPGGTAVVGAPTFTQVPNPNDGNSPGDNDYIWKFTYPYTVTVKGISSGSEAEEITATGSIVYTSTSGSAASGRPPSFSKWGAFINNFSACQGSLVPGTMTGPFFTNGQWNFGNFSNPGYTFTDQIGQAGANASWISNGHCTNATSAPRGFTNPNFESGFKLSQNQVTPPSDSYSQAQAVMDAKGIPPCTSSPCPTDNPPTAAQMNQTLKNINGTAYPTSGSPTGVYIPWYTSSGQNYFGSNPSSGGDGAGGGFYINGNAAITLSATTSSGTPSHKTQTYTISQGSTTTTIVVDNTLSTTTVTSGSTTLTLQGVPSQLDPNTGSAVTQTDPSGTVVNPTLVYVNGQITGLKGTVQDDTGITVAASNNVSITGDLTYASAPVSIPADTLNSSTNAGVLEFQRLQSRQPDRECQPRCHRQRNQRFRDARKFHQHLDDCRRTQRRSSPFREYQRRQYLLRSPVRQ